MLEFLFKVGGSLFLAVLVAWATNLLGIDGVVLYRGEMFVLTLGFLASALMFLGAFTTFSVKS